METEIFGRLHRRHGAGPAGLLRRLRVPQPNDIADAIEYAIDTPRHVNVSIMEILPTFQVVGGIDFDAPIGTDAGAPTDP